MIVPKIGCVLVQDRYTNKYGALWIQQGGDLHRYRIVCESGFFEPNESGYYKLSDVKQYYDKEVELYNSVRKGRV